MVYKQRTHASTCPSFPPQDSKTEPRYFKNGIPNYIIILSLRSPLDKRHLHRPRLLRHRLYRHQQPHHLRRQINSSELQLKPTQFPQQRNPNPPKTPQQQQLKPISLRNPIPRIRHHIIPKRNYLPQPPLGISPKRYHFRTEQQNRASHQIIHAMPRRRVSPSPHA